MKKKIFYSLFLVFFSFINFPSQAQTPYLLQGLRTTASPPIEYFSINGIYLPDGKLVQVGRDHINQNYVILPSPNVLNVVTDPNNPAQNLVHLQVYFPTTEAELTKKYQIREENIRYLLIQEAQIFDNKGNLLWRAHIPEGVGYRLQDFIDLEVGKNVTSLSFIFKFMGRAGWSDQGISSEIRSLIKSLKDLKIDSDGKLEINVKVGEQYQIKDVFSGHENSVINDIIGQFQYVTVWGEMKNHEEILKKVMDLQQYQRIDVDFINYQNSLKDYAFLFGDPPRKEWVSVLHKLSSEKLTEQEVESENAVSAKLGIDSLFSLGGDSSSKQKQRSKNLIKFDLEGDFYVPKAFNFYLRQNQSIEQIKSLLFRAYSQLEEKEFAFGLGVSLYPPVPKPAEKAEIELSSILFGTPTGIRTTWGMGCPENQVFLGLQSTYTNNLPTKVAADRLYRPHCGEVSMKNHAGQKFSLTESEISNWANQPDGPLDYRCPNNKIMTAIHSQYHHRNFDRTFRFSCSRLVPPTEQASLKVQLKNCEKSNVLNNFQQTMDYQCPNKKLMVGISSIHENRFEDRLINITCCNVDLEP